jgi:hypothetical protein
MMKISTHEITYKDYDYVKMVICRMIDTYIKCTTKKED